MGQTMASWKILEDLMIALKKKDVDIPAKVVEDLRSARSMIKLSCMKDMEDCREETIRKAEEFTANIEAFLFNAAEKVMEPQVVNDWLKRLEETNAGVCEEEQVGENKFIVGVPRDQKWVRVEPTESFPAERLEQLAVEKKLSINKQADGKFVIYGQKEDISAFIKQMVAEKPKIN